MCLTLINARPSPFGRKVAIALEEKGIDYTVRYDVPWGEETCTPQFSPLEQLPILILPDGEHVYDSSYILTWLEARYPQPALLPVDTECRLQAQLRQLLGERLMEVAQSLIFGAINKYGQNKQVSQSVLKVVSDTNARKQVNQLREGQLALNEAINKKDINLINDILALGPDLGAKDSAGVSAFDLSNKLNNKEISKAINDYKEKSKSNAGYNQREQYGNPQGGSNYVRRA